MIENVTLMRVTVVFHCNMVFSIHINTFFKKAFKTLGFINRSTSNFKKHYSFLLLNHILSLGYLSGHQTVLRIKILLEKFNINYNLQISQLGVTICRLGRYVTDIIFIYDLLILINV